MTVSQNMARKIERIAEAFGHFIATTQEDRLHWRPAADPASRTRSVLELASECIRDNRHYAALLRGENPVSPGPGREQPALPFVDGKDAQIQLVESGRELAAAVRAVGGEGLTRIYPRWKGRVSGELLLEIAYRGMAYHAGQVNYIQTLYGDTEFHLPPTWL